MQSYDLNDQATRLNLDPIYMDSKIICVASPNNRKGINNRLN